MIISSDQALGKALGLFFTVLAMLHLLVGAVFFAGSVLWPVAAALFAFCAAACFTYRHEVHIDRDSDVLEKHSRFLFIHRNSGCLLSSFRGVGLAALSTRGLNPVQLAHLVELRGRTRVVLPGLHVRLGQARAKAAEVAALLDLPLEPRIRRIFLER